MEKMKIGILGSGMVGRAHAEKLVSLGHNVVVGTHEVEKALAVREADMFGAPGLGVWHEEHPEIPVTTLEEAAAHGEVIFGALRGEVSLATLTGLKEHLGGKILIDIANPLDFSKGMPPTLSVCNTDSLGEQTQAALPDTKVVKTLNTVNAHLQVDPALLLGGDHHIFVCGNDAGAKATVTEILRDGYGWKHIMDLGDITGARGTEMLLPIWLRLWNTTGTPMLGFKIVVGEGAQENPLDKKE